MIIKDGTGTGNQLRVDANNRAHTFSISLSENQEATFSGDNYNLNSGELTLTSANESGVLYLKNTSATDLVIDRLAPSTMASTGGTGNERLIMRVYRNPTGGTLISNATEADILSNKNFGSNEAIDALVYKGVEGATVTGGSLSYIVYVSNGGSAVIPVDLVLPRGTSLAVTFEPTTGNTSQNVYFATSAHYAIAQV
jgi:hypothetical protein